MHAVHQLYQYRKSISTKPFNARGKGVTRCELCRCAEQYCICQLKPVAQSKVGFLLLMHDIEVLKPSNTGRLIADIIPQTHAFLWQRTELEQRLRELLINQHWQPIVIFPADYVDNERPLYIDNLPASITTQSTKKPLFILLDGSWREARKMFRKSDYLKHFPVLSISEELMLDQAGGYIRKAEKTNQFATAQVAAQALKLAGEHHNAALLNTWFDVFNFRYQQSVCQQNTGDKHAVERLALLVGL